MLNDSALRARLAAERQARALERFTASTMTRQLSDALSAIVKRDGSHRLHR